MTDDLTHSPNLDGQSSAAMELVSALEETFFANVSAPVDHRKQALAERLTRTLEQLSPEAARSVTDEAKALLAGGDTPAPVPVSPQDTEALDRLRGEADELREKVAELNRELQLRSAAYDQLVELSQHFLGDDARFEKEEQMRRFCGRIKSSFAIFLSAFKDLLRGRKRFQMEYAMYFGMGQSMEGTRVIRTGEDNDVGRKFFEWDTQENVEDSSNEMARALDELKYHQLAFLSGYKHAVKSGTLNVMGVLSPQKLEENLALKKISLGPIKIQLSIVPWKNGVLYKEYRRRFEDLKHEDVQFFEAKFRTAFTAGYVEVMNRKAKAQQSDE